MVIACRSVLMTMAILALGSAATADSVVLPPAKDNTLFSTGTTSNGAGDAVFSGRTGARGGRVRQRAVLAFDVAGNVPARSTITSARLRLTVIQTNSGAQEHTLHRVLKDWGEGKSVGFGGSGAPAEEDDVTWLHTFFPDD